MPPLATLTGFQANVDGQKITVAGQADLLPGAADKIKKATPRVALVQDMVPYTGADSVRFHCFVVRKLTGSAAGTPLQAAGTMTAFSESVNVTKLGKSLDAYLAKFEKDRSRNRGKCTFQDKMARIDPKQLLVVAFVQDDQTKGDSARRRQPPRRVVRSARRRHEHGLQAPVTAGADPIVQKSVCRKVGGASGNMSAASSR